MAMNESAGKPRPAILSRYLSLTGVKATLGNRLREAGWAAFTVATFASGYAQALSIHDFRVTSMLGEPLDAVVTVDAAPGEVLTASCVRAGTTQGSDLPALQGVRLSLSRSMSPGTIRLTTSRAVREPLSELVLTVDCAGTPNISRTFMIMLDPPEANASSAPVTSRTIRRYDPNRPVPVTQGVAMAVPNESSRVVASSSSRVRTSAPRAITVGTPIAPGSSYTVRQGDALSLIASRVAGRPAGSVWAIANGIHAANPGAFLLGDPNVLAEGARLYIPTLDESADGNSAAIAAAAAPESGTAAARRAASSGDEEPRIGQRDSQAAVAPSVPTVAAATRASVDRAVAAADRAAAAQTITPPAAVTLTPLPTFVLARKLSALSTNRLHLRRTGVLQVAGPAQQPAAATPTSTRFGNANATTDSTAPSPGDSNGKPTPVAVVSDNRDVLPAQSAAAPAGVRLPWWALLLAAALLIGGAAAAVLALRSRMATRYDQEFKDAVRRMRYDEDLRQARDAVDSGDSAEQGLVVEEAPQIDALAYQRTAEARPEASEAPLAPTIIMPSLGGVMGDESLDESLTGNALDLEFPELKPLDAAAPDADTVETPQFDASQPLDLELPESPALMSDETLQLSLDGAATAELKTTGADMANHDSAELEIDAELLELDYSQQFQATKTGTDWPVEELDAVYDDEATVEEPALGDDGIEATAELDLSEARSTAADEDADEPNPEAYYHLEAGSELDAAALSFETGDADKVVAFRSRDKKSAG